ncbi:MAG: tetratricopeptide repeat protein, partial [Acidobacteriota bacterium]
AAAPSTLIATSSETEGETDGGVDETSTAPPSDAADGPRLTPPLVAGGDGWLHLPWILPTGRLRPEPEPFASEAVASKAVVMRGEPLSFRILADDLEAVGSRITLELHGGDGRLSAQVPADVKSYSTPDADGRREILVQAPTADFPLGGFALAAVLGEADAPRTPPLPVLILDDYSFGADGADGEPSSWPWLVARLTAPQAPTLASGRTENSAAVDRRELVSGLDEVYDLLTDSEDSAARRRHLRLAMAVAKDHGSIGLKAMGKEEFERARRLAELTAQESEAGARANPRNAEAVLPLVSLNLELYREARRLGRTLVSTHARFMAMRLIELYLAQAGNSTVAKKTAASLFVSLGGELQLADMVYFSERIFRKALSFDERQATALLALGMNYHLIGDLQRARDSFQTLLEIDPSHTEGSLRLARLDLLEGQERRARKRLQQAIKSSGPEWALAVAYQELARLDIDEGELLAAKKTLSEGLGRFPNQPRLLMLMAFAHDASAANTRAREVLAKAGAETSGRPSPRRRFVDWSRESFVRNDRLMQEKVHRAVPVLTERWRKVRHHNAQVQAQGDNR